MSVDPRLVMNVPFVLTTKSFEKSAAVQLHPPDSPDAMISIMS